MRCSPFERYLFSLPSLARYALVSEVPAWLAPLVVVGVFLSDIAVAGPRASSPCQAQQLTGSRDKKHTCQAQLTEF